MNEGKLIVAFVCYSLPREMEFDENVRMKKVHHVLSEICKTYVITGIYIREK